MISGVENRVPFLDHELAKFCFNLKNSNKIVDGQTRYIMKEIFKKKIFIIFSLTKKKPLLIHKRIG